MEESETGSQHVLLSHPGSCPGNAGCADGGNRRGDTFRRDGHSPLQAGG